MTVVTTETGVVLAFGKGDRHRKAREYAGMDLQELAAELGVHRVRLSRIEKGEIEPSRAITIAWAHVTGVDLEWLLHGDLRARRDSNPQPSDLVLAA